VQEVVDLITREAQLKGSKKGSQVVKERAEKEYYENPQLCKHCGKIIDLNGCRPSAVRKKRFCNSSCSASHNNHINPKRKPEGNCKTCGVSILSSRKYCDACLSEVFKRSNCNVGGNKRIPKEDRRQKHLEWVASVLSMTKHDLKQAGKHPYHHKSTITRIARELYRKSNKKQECHVCDRKNAVDVCHIKDVREFPGSALIAEINNLNNLVALCKNHHWDFDHGLLDL
jgi:hypothetical protein